MAEQRRTRLRKEQEVNQDKIRCKAQTPFYTIIKVARDEDLREQIGKDIYFDLVDHDKVRSFRIEQQTAFNLFKEEVAREFGVPVQFQRFWLWAKRQNQTYRPDRPLTPQEEAQTVGALREVFNEAHDAELKLFPEVEFGLDLCPVPPPEKNKEDMLVFFKCYDPEKEKLCAGKPTAILSKLNVMAGFAPDEKIELFKEIKFEPSVMCDCLHKRASFRFSQIKDGDIVCFQKRTPDKCKEQFRFPDVPSYLEYVKNRLVVHFRALERYKEDEFCLELSVHLMGMLVHCKIKYILYYEVLDIPLPEMQCLKTLRVAFHHAKKDEVVILNHRLPKQTTVGDYLNEIKAEVELSHSNAELRLLAVFYHKIHKIPEEEKNLGPNDSLIHVHHFTKLIAHNQMVMYPLLVHNFGDPFILVIHEGEALADVKLRIQKKLQVPDEEFSTWKFASMTFGHPEYLNDSDIVSSHFQNSDVFMAWEQQYLGLEHSDTTPKRAYTVNQNRHTFEKPAEEGPAVQTAVEELPPPSLILQETAPPPPPAEQAAAEKELPPTGLVDTNNSLDEEMVVEAPPTGSRFR